MFQQAFIKTIIVVKKAVTPIIVIMMLTLPSFMLASPLDNHDDLVHDLSHIGAGVLVISATNYTLRLTEKADHISIRPWTKFFIETGMNLAIQCLYQAVAENKSPGQQTERVISGVTGGMLFSAQMHF